MRKIGILLITGAISLPLISGCGNKPDPSAQEKRNNFDKCVLDYKDKNYSGSISGNNAVDAQAPFKCRHLLG